MLVSLPAFDALSNSTTKVSGEFVSRGPRIKSVMRREETLLRLGGNGDNWHMSWADDDRQYVSLCDGFGWPTLPGYDQQNSEFNSRLYAIEGNPPDVRFQYLPDYPDIRHRFDLKATASAPSPPVYYNFGTLALDGRIFQYLSTMAGPEDGIAPTQWFVGAKLIYSPDNGRRWCNQDGSTPVVWEPWGKRSHETMVFFGEPQNAFSVITLLQMGRNYEFNRDGYVYGYAPNGDVDGTANELVMFRVLKGQILCRDAYEFFAGLNADGAAHWAHDIRSRAVVHTFPRGWVPTHAHSWVPSVVYNAPLGLYMMANSAFGVGPKGEFAAKASYLGLWVAPNPWGPWTQIHEETAWMPANDPKARAYEAQIAPKWIAPDGKSFWLVWTDWQVAAPPEWKSPGGIFNVVTKTRTWPNYAFNVQRVDLVIA